MKFNFSEEQEEFRSVVRRFLEDKSPSTAVRRLMATDTGRDDDLWRQISGDLGLTAVHIPERYGGQGFGISELAITVEEMGRALACSPYFASVVLGATAILHGANEAQKAALLPGIAKGTTIATLAITELDGQPDLANVATTATADNAGYRLHGTKSFVVDGHTADLIVVAARAPGSSGTDGLSLFTVRGDAPGLERQRLDTVDETRKLARLTFKATPAELLGEAGGAAGPLQAALDIAAICLANEMVGGAERLLGDAIDYANLRMQFGRPIASFQSLKHKAADMLLDVELAKSAAYYAAAAADEGDPELPALACIAKAGAADAYMQTAIHAVQIHGGIGFTWDNDTHLWYKRAKSSEVFLGTSAYHRERLMQCWNV